MACQTNQFFIICYFFMKLGGLGGLNEVCGIIYETIRYEHYCTLIILLFKLLSSLCGGDFVSVANTL
jgi:hypothetical protein